MSETDHCYDCGRLIYRREGPRSLVGLKPEPGHDHLARASEWRFSGPMGVWQHARPEKPLSVEAEQGGPMDELDELEEEVRRCCPHLPAEVSLLIDLEALNETSLPSGAATVILSLIRLIRMLEERLQDLQGVPLFIPGDEYTADAILMGPR